MIWEEGIKFFNGQKKSKSSPPPPTVNYNCPLMIHSVLIVFMASHPSFMVTSIVTVFTPSHEKVGD